MSKHNLFLTVVLLAAGVILYSAVRHTSIDGASVASHGAWKQEALILVDPQTQRLQRKTLAVWDTNPALHLEFTWSSAQATREGSAHELTGNGILIWRRGGRAPLDQTALVSRYRGDIVDGIRQGYGTYEDIDGLGYSGTWRAGLLHGQGSLSLPNGDRYFGAFADGKMDGRGTYISADGEVFEGLFRGGKRSGDGLTTLLNGTSYRSHWQDDNEAPASIKQRRLLLAQVDNGLTLRLSINRQETLRLEELANELSLEHVLLYEDIGNESQMRIVPRSGGYAMDNEPERLMADWKGDGILKGGVAQAVATRGVFDYEATGILPVLLLLELKNAGAAAMRVDSLFLDVSASASELQPAIEIHDWHDITEWCTPRDQLREYHPKFSLWNFGWGAAKSAHLKFMFGESANASSPYPFEQTIGEIGTSTVEISVERELLRSGVNVTRLKTSNQCDSEHPERCVRFTERRDVQAGDDESMAEMARRNWKVVDNTRLFGSISDRIYPLQSAILIDVNGVIEYQWADAAHVDHSRSSRFVATIPLGNTIDGPGAECGFPTGGPATTGQALQLRLDAMHYRVPISLGTGATIAPGQTQKLGLNLHAGRASHHQFKIVAKLADGREFATRAVDLTYFAPNPPVDLNRDEIRVP